MKEKRITKNKTKSEQLKILMSKPRGIKKVIYISNVVFAKLKPLELRVYLFLCRNDGLLVPEVFKYIFKKYNSEDYKKALEVLQGNDGVSTPLIEFSECQDEMLKPNHYIFKFIKYDNTNGESKLTDKSYGNIDTGYSKENGTFKIAINLNILNKKILDKNLKDLIFIEQCANANMKEDGDYKTIKISKDKYFRSTNCHLEDLYTKYVINGNRINGKKVKKLGNYKFGNKYLRFGCYVKE